MTAEGRVLDKESGQVAIWEDTRIGPPVMALLYFGTANKQPVRRWVPIDQLICLTDAREVILP